MGNPFVHIELNSTDAPRARKFYQGLFDWNLSDMQMGNGQTYTMVDVGKNPGGGIGGGMQPQMMPGAPSAWLSYVGVENLSQTVARARSLGGQVFEERIDVPGMGALAIIADPTGAVLGLWEPAPRPPARRAAPAKKPAKKAAKAPAKKKAAPAKKKAAPAKKRR
jgi:predicted enzyme related to lactoylglutathione lyase